MGEKIRTAREARHLTRREVADALGISDQYLYQVETGRRHASLETLWALAGHLKIDPHQLDARLAQVPGPDPSER